jgi:hypothetical protein
MRGLYELVRNHVGSIEDFFVALERTKDFARAELLSCNRCFAYAIMYTSAYGKNCSSP